MSVLALKGFICSNYKCFEIKLSNPLLAIAKKITCAKLELKKLNILKSSFNLKKKFLEFREPESNRFRKGSRNFFWKGSVRVRFRKISRCTGSIRFGSGSVQVPGSHKWKISTKKSHVQ